MCRYTHSIFVYLHSNAKLKPEKASNIAEEMEASVSVRKIVDYYDGDDDMWELIFKVSVSGVAVYFTVTEPYLCSLTKWRKLAQGVAGRVCLYQGNGEGTIEVDDDHYVFTAMPSGAGGDVALVVKIPVSCLAEKLSAAIDSAQSQGLRFASR